VFVLVEDRLRTSAAAGEVHRAWGQRERIIDQLQEVLLGGGAATRRPPKFKVLMD
jgi:hypothetical protein